MTASDKLTNKGKVPLIEHGIDKRVPLAQIKEISMAQGFVTAYQSSGSATQVVDHDVDIT